MVEIKFTLIGETELVYECIKIDNRLRGNFAFYSKEGFQFRSIMLPDLMSKTKIIYLCGIKFENDKDKIINKFKTQEERCSFLLGFNRAFKELKKYLKETYPEEDNKKITMK